MDQVLMECGITSTFVPGSEVPMCFEHRCKGPRISFSLRIPSSGEKITCFTLCISFSIVSDHVYQCLPRVYMINETKEIMRTYFSSFIGIPETNSKTMLWLIHWPTIDFQLEDGDSLSCKITNSDVNIREFGVACGSKNNIIRYESAAGLYYPGTIASDSILWASFNIVTCT